MAERFPLSGGAKVPGHKHEDFNDFMVSDFQKYELSGEFLYDGEFSQITETEKHGHLNLPLIRKANLRKR